MDGTELFHTKVFFLSSEKQNAFLSFFLSFFLFLFLLLSCSLSPPVSVSLPLSVSSSLSLSLNQISRILVLKKVQCVGDSSLSCTSHSHSGAPHPETRPHASRDRPETRAIQLGLGAFVSARPATAGATAVLRESNLPRVCAVYPVSGGSSGHHRDQNQPRNT